jgi:hypothetical protein
VNDAIWDIARPQSWQTTIGDFLQRWSEMNRREGASHFGSQTSSVKAKGKKQKLQGKNPVRLLLPFALLLLPFAFTEAMALRPGITSGVPLSVKRPRWRLRAARGFWRV